MDDNCKFHALVAVLGKVSKGSERCAFALDGPTAIRNVKNFLPQISLTMKAFLRLCTEFDRLRSLEEGVWMDF